MEENDYEPSIPGNSDGSFERVFPPSPPVTSAAAASDGPNFPLMTGDAFHEVVKSAARDTEPKAFAVN